MNLLAFVAQGVAVAKRNLNLGPNFEHGVAVAKRNSNLGPIVAHGVAVAKWNLNSGPKIVLFDAESIRIAL